MEVYFQTRIFYRQSTREHIPLLICFLIQPISIISKHYLQLRIKNLPNANPPCGGQPESKASNKY